MPMRQALNTQELLDAISIAKSEILDLISPLSEQTINTIPYKDSWTVGQLYRHVSKSTNGMAKVLKIPGTPVERDPAGRVPELSDTFLNFEHKLKSPDFIVPEEGSYEKLVVIQDLQNSFKSLEESVHGMAQAELVNNLPFGPITKLEILHFVWYHTQRHLHQLKKISKALQTS